MNCGQTALAEIAYSGRKRPGWECSPPCP